ncbi:MAG: helix-turn-helix domain-containing protein [Planctomycetes bacterium]|nr:helix-turn-helix domain-containing protein [Planctomycetota bacterium]
MHGHKQMQHSGSGPQTKGSRFAYATLIKEQNLIVCKLDDNEPFEVPVSSLKAAESWDGSNPETVDLIDGGFAVLVGFSSGVSIDFAADFAVSASRGETEVDFAAIGERIKKLRKDRRMTLAQLAQATHIAEPNLSRLEKGKVTPMIPTLQKIAKAFGVTAGALLRG